MRTRAVLESFDDLTIDPKGVGVNEKNISVYQREKSKDYLHIKDLKWTNRQKERVCNRSFTFSTGFTASSKFKI